MSHCGQIDDEESTYLVTVHRQTKVIICDILQYGELHDLIRISLKTQSQTHNSPDMFLS